MNRRANVFDAILIVIALFAIAFTAIATSLVINVVRDEFHNDTSIPQDALDIIDVADQSYSGVMDFWVVLFLIGFPLISAGLAFFTNIHPVFFWISLVIVVLVVLYGASLKIFWEELAEDSLIAGRMAKMPMTDFVFKNYGIYSFFVFVVISFGTYARVKRGPAI